MRQIGEILPELESCEEAVLIRWVQTEKGQLKDWAFEELLKRHQQMIYKLSNRYHFKDYDWVDKENFFTVCLFKAIQSFKLELGTKLTTHYYQVVKHEVFLVNQHQNSVKRGGSGMSSKEEAPAKKWTHVSTEVLIKDDLKLFTKQSTMPENQHQLLLDKLCLQQIEKEIRKEADQINQQLLRGYLLKDQSIQELANELGFKHSNTSQRLKRALGRMRVSLQQQGWSCPE